MAMIRQEAEDRASALRSEFDKIYKDVTFKGGEFVWSCEAQEERLPDPSTGEYIPTGMWVVVNIMGWKARRNHKKYGNYIFHIDEVPSPEALEKLLEVLQIQMDRSLAKIT